MAKYLCILRGLRGSVVIFFQAKEGNAFSIFKFIHHGVTERTEGNFVAMEIETLSGIPDDLNQVLANNI